MMIRYLKRVFAVGILIVFLLLTIGILYNIENNKTIQYTRTNIEIHLKIYVTSNKYEKTGTTPAHKKLSAQKRKFP